MEGGTYLKIASPGSNILKSDFQSFPLFTSNFLSPLINCLLCNILQSLPVNISLSKTSQERCVNAKLSRTTALIPLPKLFGFFSYRISEGGG